MSLTFDPYPNLLDEVPSIARNFFQKQYCRFWLHMVDEINIYNHNSSHSNVKWSYKKGVNSIINHIVKLSIWIHKDYKFLLPLPL